MEFENLSTISTSQSVFRVAHISDTHISPEYHRTNIFRLKRLLELAVDDGYDHIAITGDITANAEESGYRSVRRLLKHFGLLDRDRLSVTIGNHDIFGGVHRAEDLLTFGKTCRATDYRKKIRLFESAFSEVLPRKAYEGENVFPYVKIIGPLAVVALNSIREFHPFLNPVGSNGLVPDAQMEEAERILNHPSLSSLKKVVLVHHHFNKYEPHSDSIGASLYHKFEARTLKLHRSRRVEEMLKRCGVDVVLHGHTHIEGIYSRSGIIYSSTALTPIRAKNDEALEGDDRHLRFNEIAVQESGSITATKRKYAVGQKGSSSHAVDRKLRVE